MSARWYVVQTHAHAETKAIAHLARQGFKAYLPRYLKRRRHARRIETVSAPLFPRYLFVTIDMVCQRWRAIRSTIGVARLVCNGDDPVPVADNIIETLKRARMATALSAAAAAAVCAGRESARARRRLCRLSRPVRRHERQRSRGRAAGSARPQGSLRAG